MNGREVERVNSFKFFGVIIDNKLNFRDHIGSICLKVSKWIAIFRSLNFLLPIYFYFTLQHYSYSFYILYFDVGCCLFNLLLFSHIDKINNKIGWLISLTYTNQPLFSSSSPFSFSFFLFELWRGEKDETEPVPSPGKW